MKSISSKDKYQPSESIRELSHTGRNESGYGGFLPARGCDTGFSVFLLYRASSWQCALADMGGKIVKAPDGKTLFVRTKIEKTQKIVNVPLSKEAIDCLNPKENNDEPIFTLPTGTSNIERNIEKWMQAAKIAKHITYHCTRHTFYASNLLDLVG